MLLAEIRPLRNRPPSLVPHLLNHVLEDLLPLLLRLGTVFLVNVGRPPVDVQVAVGATGLHARRVRGEVEAAQQAEWLATADVGAELGLVEEAERAIAVAVAVRGCAG